MAEFKNTVADARDTISIMVGLEAGVPTPRFCCPSKRLRSGRSREALLGIAREAIERFRKAVDAHCRRGERGLMVLGPTEALSLSERAEDLLDAVHALDLGMKSTVTPVPDANPGAWELIRKLGRDGESADAQAAIQAATYAVAYPIERLNSGDGPKPGGPNRRYRAGEIVHEEDLRRLRRAQAALELALLDARRTRDQKPKVECAPRAPRPITPRQRECWLLYQQYKNYAKVARELGIGVKVVRGHVAAAEANMKSVGIAGGATQALPMDHRGQLDVAVSEDDHSME